MEDGGASGLGIDTYGGVNLTFSALGASGVDLQGSRLAPATHVSRFFDRINQQDMGPEDIRASDSDNNQEMEDE